MLDEKRLPYEPISVPFSRATSYRPRHPMVVRVNPKQRVPVLVDGDLAIYDSSRPRRLRARASAGTAGGRSGGGSPTDAPAP